jgi:hypothetical protein
MEHLAAGRRQEREDTGFIVSQGMLFDEARLAYQRNSS